MTIKDYDFVQTSPAFPEQYDVFDSNGTQVAYVRLRHGDLYAACVHGDGYWYGVYYVELADIGSGKYGYGSFSSEEERMYHLNAIVDAIQDHYLHKLDIKTVGDLIKALQNLPQDAKITYDHDRPILFINAYDNEYTICQDGEIIMIKFHSGCKIYVVAPSSQPVNTKFGVVEQSIGPEKEVEFSYEPNNLYRALFPQITKTIYSLIN